MSRNPTTAELLNRAIESALGDIYMGMPGKVVRYDADKQEADVQPLIKVSYIDEAGERKLEALPVVPSVPVIFQGGGGFVVQFPIDVGDTVWLMFTAVSIDKWLKVGTTGGSPVDPESDSRHALADAVALPGLRSFKDKRPSVEDGLTLGKEGGNQIKVLDGQIYFGSLTAAENMVLGQAFKTLAEALFDLIVAHTHPDALGGTGAPANAAAFTALKATIPLSLSDFIFGQKVAP